MREAYLDNSATTPVCPQAAQKILEMMTVNYGNPSSLHTKGIDAQNEIESARRILADELHCRTDELFFTSGGTEANNMALFGTVEARKRVGNKIVVSAVSHSSVIESAAKLEKDGVEVAYIGTDGYGRLDAEAFANALDEKTVLASVEMVNNETGAVQPIESIGRAIKRKKLSTALHIDAVQAFGKINVNPQKFGAQLLTVSAHKIFGPKGCGALYVQKGMRIIPRTFGGEQEKKMRPGTESSPLIAGFGEAVRQLREDSGASARISELRERCILMLEKMDGITVNSPADASPYVINFSVPGIRSETMLHHLASRGVFVSSGSACAKGHKSHVLEAMGLDRARIDSAIRVSFGKQNTYEDVEQLLTALDEGMKTLTRAKY